MYNTMREVVEAVKEKCQGVRELSRLDGEGCFYSHKYNGVGCAIGCLFPADVAESFDKITEPIYPTVKALIDDGEASIIRQTISPDVSSDELNTLQRMHDTALDAEEFRGLLDNFLSTGKYIPAQEI